MRTAQKRAAEVGKERPRDSQDLSVVWLPSSFERLLQAFDIAWPTLMSVDSGLPRDAARRQLADAVLLFAEDKRDAAAIAKAALQKLGV